MSAYCRGYLNEPFRIFHPTDKSNMDFDAHFHTFHKVVVCLQGHVTYTTEGRVISLGAGDTLIVPMHFIHKSSLSDREPYERVLLFLRDDFLRSFSDDALCRLFEGEQPRLLHPERDTVLLLRSAEKTTGLLQKTYLVQFLLLLEQTQSKDVLFPEQIESILRYLAENLASPLRVSDVAGHFFLSESRLMHLFKQYTGYSLHQYITQKRLIRVTEEMEKGMRVTDAARKMGFEDYSVFLRAYKKVYGHTPTQSKK